MLIDEIRENKRNMFAEIWVEHLSQCDWCKTEKKTINENMVVHPTHIKFYRTW